MKRAKKKEAKMKKEEDLLRLRESGRENERKDKRNGSRGKKKGDEEG